MLQFFINFIDIICLFSAFYLCLFLFCSDLYFLFLFSVVVSWFVLFFSLVQHSLVMICVIPLSFSRFFCRLLNFFSFSRTVSTLIEVKFLNDLMTFLKFVLPSSVYLFLFVAVASFLFFKLPSGNLLSIHYKSFPSSFVFLLHFHTFLLVLLFLLCSSDTETAKYFKTFDVGFVCICFSAGYSFETCSSVVFSHLK